MNVGQLPLVSAFENNAPLPRTFSRQMREYQTTWRNQGHRAVGVLG